MLTLLFGAISLLYATVGQAGGTAFLALMAFAAFAPGEMRPTALLLNIVAASYSTWLYNRGGLVEWTKLRPLLFADTGRYAPAALAGAMIGATVGLRWLSQAMTHHVLAVILGAAGIQLLFF